MEEIKMKTIKKVMKFIGLSFLGLIVLGIVIAACSDEPATETKETASPKVEEKVEPKKEAKKEKPAPKKEEKQYNIGDTLKVGDVTFTVHGKSTASNVGGQYGQSASGKYLIIDLTVKNEGKEAMMINSSYFKVLGNGAEYEADATADIYANEAGKSFFLQDINPGIEFKGKIVFDLPADVVDSNDLKLNVQTGAWGTEQGKVNLK
jgi:hypothetical protein